MNNSSSRNTDELGALEIAGIGFEVPDEALALFKTELEPGERLLWAGESGRRVSSEGIGWVGALVWFLGCLAVCVVCTTVLFSIPRFQSNEGPVVFLGFVFGIVAFLILVGMIASALSKIGSRSDRARDSVYALTDRRAIFRHKMDGKAVRVVSLRRGQVGHIHRVESADGSGDVFFHLPEKQTGYIPTTMDSVPDVRRVEDLARRVLLAPVSESS